MKAERAPIPPFQPVQTISGTWYFVFGGDGTPLAAFPSEELAEMYSDGTGWTICPLPIATKGMP